ncbi:MAG TPA: DUF481 domain-containing protein [Opitutaceae bacterium]|nr:DUF481 domain-containing protein [Opitutaceae bacterium]
MIRQILMGGFFCLWAAAVLRADDWLEFNNGERVTGHYVKTEKGVIFFDSTRFGPLQVSTGEAQVLSSPSPPAAPGMLASAAGRALAIALAPQTTAVPPAVAVGQRRAWKGRIDTLFDFIWGNNNTNSRETKVQGTAERLSGKEHYLAYANLDYLYNEHLLVQNHLEGRFTWEHQLSRSVYSIAEPDYLHEIRQNPIYQYQMRTGLGTQLFQTDRSQVRIAALAYFSRLDVPAIRSHAYDVYPAVRLDSQWEIWRGLKFTQEGNAFYVPGSGTGGVDNTMSLVKGIFGDITLTLQHEYHHEMIPHASITRNELKLLLGYAF